MKLLDHEGNVLEWDADEAGAHSSVLRLYSDGDSVSSGRECVLRPDAALALGSALREWALLMARKGGLF